MQALIVLSRLALLTLVLGICACPGGSGQLLVEDDDSVAGDDDSDAGDDDSVGDDDDSTPGVHPFAGDFLGQMELWVDFSWGAAARGQGGDNPFCDGEVEWSVSDLGLLDGLGTCDQGWGGGPNGGGDNGLPAAFDGEVTTDGEIAGTLVLSDPWTGDQEFELTGTVDSWEIQLQWVGIYVMNGGPGDGSEFDAEGSASGEIQ